MVWETRTICLHLRFSCLSVTWHKTTFLTQIIEELYAWDKNLTIESGLQIYGGPGSFSHDFKIWPITFQGSVGPVDPSYLVVKKSHINKNIHLTGSLHKTECTCR